MVIRTLEKQWALKLLFFCLSLLFRHDKKMQVISQSGQRLKINAGSSLQFRGKRKEDTRPGH